MIRPLECFIGLRYLGTVGGRGLVSFMSFASLAGIALGVAAVIVILSAMNGLEAESRTRLLSLAEHITLRPESGSGEGLMALRERLAGVADVDAVTPFVRLEAMLQNGSQRRSALTPVVVRGIDPAAEGFESELAAVVGPDELARLTAGSRRILLGRFVAIQLGVTAGDAVDVWLARVEDGQLGIRKERFTVADAISAGVEAHDANLALMNIVDAGRLLGLNDTPEGLAIRLLEPMNVAAVMQELEAEVGPGFRWSNWALEYRSLFRAMAIEKTVMTIVLMFIVGVAAFNIVASLMMVVNEKARDIAVLRTLGLEPHRVMRVFLAQGAVIGVGGTLIGVAIGLALAFNLETVLPWLERTFGFQIMPGDVFYVSTVPSEVHLSDVLLIPGLTLVIAALATVYPSRRAARIDPAEVLRYE
jgi:lipoprotein-releasing system permease protein